MKKKIAAVLIILLVCLLSLYFVTAKKKNSNELTLFGNIEIRQVDLSFQVAGQIKKMLKEEGDTVKSGELVALLDDIDYVANYQKASAALEQCAALNKDAQSRYNRQIPLCKADVVSKQECETLLNTKDKTAADYKSALAAKNYAKNQLAYTKIYAPDEGIVTIRVQEPGATVNKGQIVYTISKSKPVWIRAYVQESDLGNVKYKMKAHILTDAIDPKTGKNRQYEGYVGYISPVAEFTPKTVQSTDIRTNLVYRIRVYIDEVDQYLRQGMPVTVKIDLAQDEHSKN